MPTPSDTLRRGEGGRPWGVLGRVLGHSYTPVIYRELANLAYERFEREPEEVEAFLRGGAWEGVNVTIPYKKLAAEIVDELSPAARRLGNVNTVTRLEDGRLRGDNTDYYGFRMLVESLGIDFAGKRALVFGGHGGAGSTCMVVLGDLGMEPVAVCRRPEGSEGAGAASAYPSTTYEELDRYADAALIVNATPVGMYPNCPDQAYPLDGFDRLEAVVDIIYNPARTALMMEAERRGIPTIGGLLMLVAQAAAAVERYTGEEVPMDRILEVTRDLDTDEETIALIGMPGAGKTRVGRELARLMGREHVDIDAVLEERFGCTCERFINERGEEAFRAAETEELGRYAARSGLVVSCGGGVVTRGRNYPLLHQNARIVMLDRPLEELSSKGRPLSKRTGVRALAAERMDAYRTWADLIVASRETAAATAQAVKEELCAH